MKFGAGACEVFSLLGSHGADFAPATGVDGVELGGDDCGWECWDGCRSSFVGEQAGDKGGLESAGMGVPG